MAWMKFGETCRARLNSQRPSRLFCRVRAVADALTRNFDPRRLTSAIDGRTPGGAPTGVGLRVAAGRNQTGGLKSAQARSLRRSQSPEGAASRSAGLWTGPPCPGGTAMTRKRLCAAAHNCLRTRAVCAVDGACVAACVGARQHRPPGSRPRRLPELDHWSRLVAAVHTAASRA